MSVTSERLRASRLSDRTGAVLIVLGVVGFVASVVMTAWVIHDLDKSAGAGNVFSTISKLQAAAIVGLTPGMLSLLVVALGVYLQTRATELLFGVAVDHDLFVEADDDDADLPEPD